MPAHQSILPDSSLWPPQHPVCPHPTGIWSFCPRLWHRAAPRITLTSTVMLAKARALQGCEIQVSGLSQLRNRNCGFWPSPFTSLVHPKAEKGAKTEPAEGKHSHIETGLSLKFVFPSCELLCICAVQKPHCVACVWSVAKCRGTWFFFIWS